MRFSVVLSTTSESRSQASNFVSRVRPRWSAADSELRSWGSSRRRPLPVRGDHRCSAVRGSARRGRAGAYASRRVDRRSKGPSGPRGSRSRSCEAASQGASPSICQVSSATPPAFIRWLSATPFRSIDFIGSWPASTSATRRRIISAAGASVQLEGKVDAEAAVGRERPDPLDVLARSRALAVMFGMSVAPKMVIATGSLIVPLGARGVGEFEGRLASSAVRYTPRRTP